MTILDLSPDVTLYHGDCMDILPTLAGVDAVIDGLCGSLRKPGKSDVL